MLRRISATQGFKLVCRSDHRCQLLSQFPSKQYREENRKSKLGGCRKAGMENLDRLQQKDLDARWVKRMVPNYYGTRNNICIDGGP